MSQDFLSQEEVDALLMGVTGEPDEVSNTEADRGTDVRLYDLTNQDRILRTRMPNLELINERFARQLRIALFNFMRRTAEISVGPIRVVKYNEFVRNLVVPTNLNIVQVKPLRGKALFIFEPNLVFLVVDNLFGGDGRFYTRAEGRDFTQTEHHIIQRLLGLVFEEYEKSWRPVQALKLERLGAETNTQFVHIANPTDVVVATTFHIEFGVTSGEFHICLPYAMLEPLHDLLYSNTSGDATEVDKRWKQMLGQQVQTAEVELTATLGHTALTLNQILKMKAGDVIALEIAPAIAAAVDGVPVIECHYGVFNGQYALKVERMLANPAIE